MEEIPIRLIEEITEEEIQCFYHMKDFSQPVCKKAGDCTQDCPFFYIENDKCFFQLVKDMIYRIEKEKLGGYWWE